MGFKKKRKWLESLKAEIDTRALQLENDREELQELTHDLLVAHKDFILSECLNEKDWELAIDSNHGVCLYGSYVVDRPILHEFTKDFFSARSDIEFPGDIPFRLFLNPNGIVKILLTFDDGEVSELEQYRDIIRQINIKVDRQPLQDKLIRERDHLNRSLSSVNDALIDLGDM